MAHRAYRQWHEAEMLCRMGYVNDGLRSFGNAYILLSSNGSFLVDYAEMLTSIGKFGRAIKKFDDALPHRVHHSIYMSLGVCYYEVGELGKAEQAFLQAIYMVPNRFESRLALFDFYTDTDQKEKAAYWGESILNLLIKVSSQRVDLIKQDVADRIAENE